jgi:hypothetical protein
VKLIDTRMVELVRELADGSDFVFIQLPDNLEDWVGDPGEAVPIEILSNMSLAEMEYAVLALARQIVDKEVRKQEKEEKEEEEEEEKEEEG